MKQKDLLYLVISIFLLTVLWIGFNIYDTAATTTISEVLQVQIIPISPDFDPATIRDLKKREKVTPVYSTTAREASPTPTVPVASSAAVPATQSTQQVTPTP